MTFTATVEDGKVVLPPEIKVPTGTKVRVETLEAESASLADSLKDFIGIFEDLPADLARNHDHYVHGTPRK